MDPQRLMQMHPWLDHLMAETLLKLHEQGKLRGYVDEWPEEEDRGPPTSKVIVGAVEVETPPEKCVVSQ